MKAMEVTSILAAADDSNAAPRTPPRGDGADDDGAEENDGADDGDGEPDEDSGEEEEDESSSSKKRGRRIWEVLSVWDRTQKLDSEIDAEILGIATAKMEESGLVEWPSARRPAKTIGLWTLGHAYTRDAGKVDITAYYCPLIHRCKCPVQIRVTRTVTSVCLEYSGGPHTQARCHATDKSKFLKFQQRIAVAKVVKVNPAATGSDVRLALQQLSPSGKVQVALARSVRSVVKIQKKKSLVDICGGIEVTNSYSALGERLWFGDIIRKHNSGEIHFSDPHEVFCIGNVSPEAAGEELFLNVATTWGILNLGRGLISGWPNVLCGDGTGKLSKFQVTMVSFGITSIPAKFNTLNYCIGPVENCDLYSQSWEGVKSTWYAFMKDWKCCPMSYAHCRVCALITQMKMHPDVVKSLETQELIHKAKSDNTDLFRNFADSIGAIPLTCDVHGSGDECPVDFIISCCRI